MLQSCGECDLTLEALDGQLGSDLRCDDFDDDAAAQRPIFGYEHA